MANKITPQTLELIENIKSYVKTQYVMSPVAYGDVKAREKTINNVYEKVIEGYFLYIRHIDIAPEVEYEIKKIINCRILIG